MVSAHCVVAVAVPCAVSCPVHDEPKAENNTWPVGAGALAGWVARTVAEHCVTCLTCTGDAQDTDVAVGSGCTLIVVANAGDSQAPRDTNTENRAINEKKCQCRMVLSIPHNRFLDSINKYHYSVAPPMSIVMRNDMEHKEQ